MPNEKNVNLKQAAKYWQDGQPLEAGRIIFENLAPDARPKWAATILSLVVEKSGKRIEPIERLRRIAANPREWVQAHDAFSMLRESTLELERLSNRSDEQTLLLRQLYLAENVAKVVYNATNPTDEFDEDSGWWIAPCLKKCLDSLNDDEFSDSAWRTLITEPPNL
jgi:hypothetical protein